MKFPARGVIGGIRQKYIIVVFLLVWCVPFVGNAQELHQDLQETVRAEVVEVVDESTQEIIGTDTVRVVQNIRVRIHSGEKEGDVVRIENDYVPLAVGDAIYVNRIVTINGDEIYALKDVDRTRTLLLLAIGFALVLILFAGFHGARALLSLALSVLLIMVVLVPLLLKGYPPVLVSVLVAGPILALTLFLTHGLHGRVVVAFLGTFGAVIVTGLLATLVVSLARLTGLSSDEAIYLNFSTFGKLDFGGILLGSIIIGILGVLDDVSITQASVVAELKRANRALSYRELYVRALRVGRDHIGSLVNTLSLAYVGASLPLILLMVQADADLVLSLNQEIIAVELIRIFVGSIGLILAVPLTTLIAGWWFTRYPIGETEDAHHGHTHAQGH